MLPLRAGISKASLRVSEDILKPHSQAETHTLEAKVGGKRHITAARGESHA